MRIFVAIDLSNEIKDYLFNLQKEIGNQYAKIRWMGKSQLHLTLKFFVKFIFWMRIIESIFCTKLRIALVRNF